MIPFSRPLLLSALAAGLWACSRQPAASSPTTSAGPVAAAPVPNANAAPYGPHGVSAVPAAAPAGPADAPPLDPSQMDMAAMAGHPCACGKTCHCGHCSGAVPGCHCKTKRADGK